VALLLFTNVVSAGLYQRTKDGKTLVWNSNPKTGDQVTWSGGRDSKGYAAGHGTVTWTNMQAVEVTGSNIPSEKRRSSIRYTGNMVRGKLDGAVANVDANGQTFHATSASGNKTTDLAPGQAAAPPAKTPEKTSKKEIDPPAEGPPREKGPPPAKTAASKNGMPKKLTAIGDLPKPIEHTTPSPPPVPSVEISEQTMARLERSKNSFDPAPVDAAHRMIDDFKDQTDAVLSQIGAATNNFHKIDRLDLVKPVPASVSENVDNLADREQDLSAQVGSETMARECATESGTVEALVVIDQAIGHIAANNPARAGSRLGAFLKMHPEPLTENQKAVWGYLLSLRTLCARLEKEAEAHLQRAEGFLSAGKNSEAIREYEEAYRTFPNPVIAEKIRTLKSNSLGL
jgi:hypothetical protein